MNRKNNDISALVYSRIPPQATELEAAILGAVILERDRLTEVLEIIQNAEVFYLDTHQKIYAAIQELSAKGGAVDMHTIIDQLRKNSHLEDIGGAYYIAKLTMDVVSSAHVEAHARIVLEKYVQRELIRVGGDMVGKGYEDSADVFDLMDKAEAEFHALTLAIDSSGQNTILTSAQSGTQVLKELYEMQGKTGEITGVPTGIPDLDTLTSGWQKTDLIIIAGRPGQGKTALALNLMITAAKANVPVLCLSQEMSHRQLTQRVFSNMASVDFGHVRSGHLAQWELEAVAKANKVYSGLPITLDEKAAVSIHSLRRKVKRWISKQKMAKEQFTGLLIVDYLQLLTVPRMAGMTTNDVVSMKSEMLKTIAKDFGIPVIALSQLSRDVEKRKGLPQLSDLRDSGSIEQDADVVIFIHHDNGTKLIVAKQRNGRTDDVPVKFVGKYQRFTDVNELPDEADFKPFSAGIAAAAKNHFQDEPF